MRKTPESLFQQRPGTLALSYRSTSTAVTHPRIRQTEKSHWGAPSCRLMNRYCRSEWTFYQNDQITAVVCCACRRSPFVSPARNCRAWRTKSDQQGTAENHVLRVLAGHDCHVCTLSSSWESKMQIIWSRARTDKRTGAGRIPYHRCRGEIFCSQDVFQQAEKADGYFFDDHWAALSLLHNSVNGRTGLDGTRERGFLTWARRQTHSSLMLGRGVDGVSGRELMTLVGVADKVSEGARVSIGSSHSNLIGLIFFLRRSSLSFLLGRDSSNSAGTQAKGKKYVCK